MSTSPSCIFLECLHPRDFRNLQDAPVRFGTAANVIAGGNGEGKSNLLEAIGYLSVLKSFRTSRDAEVSRFGSEGFSVSGAIGTAGFLPQNVQITYRRHAGKRITLNDEPIPRFSDVIGLFPTVFLGIEQFPIITEGPKERRRFLDLALSQLYPSYLMSLIRYKRILQQRNSLLSSGHAGQIRVGLQSWNSGLIEAGLVLAQARQVFLDELQEPANQVYANVLGPQKQHILEIQYRPNIDPAQPNADALFDEALELSRDREMYLKRTLVGPHRDDVVITVNGRDLRRHGSQGEQKSALFALKMAELKLIQIHKQQVPAVLIDDLFSMLDHTRVTGILRAIQQTSQVFITTTDGNRAAEQLTRAGYPASDIMHFSMNNGVTTTVDA